VNEKTKRKISKTLTGKPKSLEARKNMSLGQRGHKGSNWKGGRRTQAIFKNGVRLLNYIYKWCPEHPFATKQGYVFEHRLAMEQKIGRFLTPEEVVHHKNGNTIDNKIENLELFDTNSKHIKSHKKEREENQKFPLVFQGFGKCFWFVGEKIYEEINDKTLEISITGG